MDVHETLVGQKRLVGGTKLRRHIPSVRIIHVPVMWCYTIIIYKGGYSSLGFASFIRMTIFRLLESTASLTRLLEEGIGRRFERSTDRGVVGGGLSDGTVVFGCDIHVAAFGDGLPVSGLRTTRAGVSSGRDTDGGVVGEGGEGGTSTHLELDEVGLDARFTNDTRQGH
jgi:hypothetical protein